MLTEIYRLITMAISLAHILWCSGSYARCFNLQTGKKAFYLRYRALPNSYGCGTSNITRHQSARFC
jgi:hypothetical protein